MEKPILKLSVLLILFIHEKYQLKKILIKSIKELNIQIKKVKN